MYKGYRYKDPILPAYGKTKSNSNITKPNPDTQVFKSNCNDTSKSNQKSNSLFNLFSVKKPNSLQTDDYILMLLIFMLVKNSDKPDWPLIFALFYILSGDN